MPHARWAFLPLTRRLAETAGAMKVADGFEPRAVIGRLIDMKAVEKVEARIADAILQHMRGNGRANESLRYLRGETLI